MWGRSRKSYPVSLRRVHAAVTAGEESMRVRSISNLEMQSQTRLYSKVELSIQNGLDRVVNGNGGLLLVELLHDRDNG